ncbi:hypothetical protein L6164_005083 [Bauhinia variegata]|uniref:Uncharacterized protein n=1 Tax=Bauhinia variegata TaxID=167791 RepID=A0ACB9PQ68_BAUVA|nr:hypothetical protein L6164_005083 [Bauhinia variegata]
MATEANIPQDEPAKHNTGLEDRDLMIEQFDSISNESSREGSVKPSYGLNQFPQGFECSSEAEKADIIGEQTKNVNSAELSSPDKAPTEDIRKSGHCQADAIKNQELTHICENENLQSKNIETGADKNEVIDGINVEEEHVHEKVKDAAQVSRLGGEDERVTESSIETEDIDNNNTKYAEDQNEEITLKSGQNEKKEMPSVQEVERKAPESVMSSNKSEHCYEEHELMHDSNEDASAVNVEESPYKHSLEEATSETTSKNGASTGVALEAGEIMNHASFKDCQEKNKDNESIWQEKYVPAIGGKDITEKSTWLNRDEGEAKEDEFNQIGFSETIENSKLTPENAEKSTEQVRHLIEKYEEEEEKDKPTSIIDSVETSLPAEKTQLLESTTKNESDVDSKCPLVEKTEQAESGETCEVSQTEQTCAENENQAKDQSEEEITENMVITHANSEGMVTMEITPKPGEGNELDEVPKTLTETRVEIVDGRKVIPEAKEGDAADDMQLHKTAIESEPENEATLRSPSTEFIRDEAIEQGFQEESTKDAELTLATDNESPTQESIKDVEINTKVDETFDEHKSTDREKTLDVTSEGSSADASGVPDNTTGMVVVDDSKKNEAENQEEGEQSHTENSVSKSQEKENTPRTLSSASGIETGKEHPEEDEETKEQIVAAYSTERKISSISDDFMEPKENLGDLTTEENKNNLVENSKCTSGVFEKDDCTTNDFETNFLKDASEGNTSMKEVRPINEDPLKTSDAAPENRNIETIETKAISLDNVDIDEKQEEEVISEENRNIKVADVADEGGQEMSHDIKEKAQITIIEHENEVTVSIPDKTPATVDPSYVDSETSFIVHSKRDSMLVSSDNEHLNADEGTQKHPEEDLVTLKAQNNISGREETEQWKGEQFSSLTDENDTSKLVIAKEKSIVDVSNNIDDVSCNEKPELEEEEHVEKSEANSAVVGVEREAAEQTKIGSSITEEEPDETKDDELKDENEASHLEIVEEESTVEVPKHIEDVSCMDSKKAEQKNEELVEKAEANSAVVGVEREAAQLTEVGSSSTKEELADTKDVELAYKNAATELEIVKEEKSTVEMLKHAQDIPSHSLEDEKADQEDEELVEKSEANSSVGVETEATELKARSSNTEEEPAETKDDELEDENETSHLEIVEEESTVEVPKHIEDVPCLDKEKNELENEELVKKAEANSAAVGEEREEAQLTEIGSSSAKEELADTKETELADKNAATELEIVKEEKSTVEILKHIEDVPSHSLDDEKADLEDGKLVEKSEANSSVGVEREAAELRAESSITEEEPAETKDAELEDENETSHLEIVAEESTVEVPKHIEEVSSMDSKNAELKNEELVKKVEANSPVVEAEREAAEVTDVGSSSTKEELADTKNTELADKNAVIEWEIVKEKSTVEMLKHVEDVPSHSLEDEKADQEDVELVEKSEANSSVRVETGEAELKAGSSITEEEPAETKDDELEDENETSHLEIVAEESTIEVSKHIEEVSSMESKNAELKNEELVKKVEANSPVVEAEREAAEVTNVGSSSTKEELADTKNAELADKNAASELEIVKEEKSTVEMLKHIEDVPSYSLDDEKADLEGGELVEKSEANSSVGVETGAAELRAGSSITEEEPAETKDDELEDENETSHLEIVAEESTVEVPKYIEEVSSMDSKNAELKNEELVEKVEANSPVVEAEREAAEVTDVGSSSTKEELADTKNAELADKSAASELEIVKEEKSTVEMLKHIEDVPSHSLDDEKADLEGGELVEKSEANSSVGVETGAAELRAGSSITEEEPAETKDDELEDENETSHLEIVAEESTVEVPKHIEEVSSMDSKNAELKNEELVEKVEANSPVVEAEREAAEVTDVGSSSTKEELADTKNAELADKNAATELEIVKEEKSTVEMLKHIEDVPSHSLDDEKADLEGGELVEKSEANSSVGVETGAAELRAGSSITEEEPAETKDDELEDENETSHLEIVAEESTVEVPKHIEEVSCMDGKNAELKNEELIEKVEANSPVVEAEREAAEVNDVGSSSTKEELADTKNAELADKNAAIELEIADLKGGELVEKSEANSSVGVETEAEQLKAGSSINEEEPAETKYDELEDENEASHLEIVEEESTVEVPKHIEEVSSMNKEKFEQENEELVEKAEDNSVVVGAEREAAEPTEVGSSSIEEEFADTKNAELEIVKEDKSTVEVLKPTEDVPSHSLDDEKTDLEDEECVENYEANSSVGVEREATELKASSITEEEPGETKDDDLEDENETSHLKIVEVPKHIKDVSCMDKEKTELENEELVEKAEANSGVAGVEREAAEQIEVGSSSTEEEPAETKNAALADKSAAFKLEIVKEEMPTVEVLKHVEDFSSYSLDNEEDKMEDGELVEKKKDVSCVDKGKTELEDVELVKKAEVNSAVAVVEREATELEAVSSSTEEELANSKNNDLLIEKADRTNENSPCESDHTVDSPEKILDMSQQKKEKSLLGENGNSTPEGASIDDHHEHANSASVGEDIGEESGLVSKDHENVKENKAENPEVLMTDNASQATGEEIIKACESSKSEASVPKSQEEIENPVGTLFSASVGKEKGKEYPNDDKNEDTKTTEEVQVTSSESKEEIEETCVENFSEISSIEHSKGASTLGSSENEKENSDEGNQKHQDEHEALPSELKTETNISDAEETEQKTPLTDENEASKLEIVKDGKLTVQVSKHNEDVSCTDVEKAKLEDDLLIEKSEGNSVIVAVEREASELKAGSSSTEEPVDTKNDELADRNVASKLEFVEHESPIEVPRHIEDASCVDNKKTELENEDLVEKVEGNLVTAAVERDAAELIAGSSSIEEEPADTKNGELVDRNDASDLEIVEDESTAEVPKHIEDASCTENEKAELDELADKNEAPDLEINEKTEQENEDLAEKVEGISAVVEVERETSELKAAIYSTEEEPTEPKSDEVADGDDAPKLEIVEDESTTGVPKHAEDVSCMDNEKIELVNEDLVEKVEGNSAIVTEEREEAELRISDTKEEPADPKTDKVADGNDASKLEIVEDESTIGVPKHVEDASCVDNEKVELENEDLVEKFEGKSAIVAVERKAAELKAGISSTEEEPVDPKSDELADGNDAPKLEIVEYESTIEVPKHMEDALCVENEDLVEKVEGNLAIFAAEREAAKLQAESSSTNEEPTNPKSDKLADRNDASKVEIVEDESTIEVPKHAEDASCMDDEKIELENEDLIEKIEGNPAVVAVKRDTTELKAGSSRNEEEPSETNVDELLRKEADGKDEDTHTKSDHNMGSTEKILSMLVQRKEESHVPGGASLEDQDECTHSISVVDDEKSGLAEGKDQDAEITLKCEEQLKQTPQNDGKEILEELPNMISEGSKAEASTEYPENTNTAEEPTATRLEKFSQMKSEAENQESNRTDENIPCESNENVEGAAEILVTSLKTKDKSLSEEHNNPTPREDSIEVQDEYANSVSAAKHNDEEDSKQLLQNDGKETLEELPDGIFAGKVADASGEYPKNTICTTAEETTARLERTSQKENIEGNVKDTEAENQEVLVTTGTIQADRENMIKVFESSNTEDSVSKPQEIENTVRTLPSAPMETEPRKECPEEDESEETKMKEEVKVTITQAKEQIEEAYSAEEKVSNISDDFLEPKEVQGDWSTEENKNNLDGNSSSISGVFDKEQLETSDPTTENKHVTDIETKANSLDSVNIDEKQEEETVSEETRDLKVAEVEDESGQRMYCDIKDKALITGINHEKEVTISTAILDDQSVHTFIDSSALPAYEEPKTKDKTPEIDRTIYVDSETCFIGHSKGDSLLESSDNKKENADEGIQKPRDEDLDVSSERITENNDDREKWKTEQVSGLADRHDNCNLENVNDEGSTVEVLKHIEVVTCLNSEKSVPEDEELVEESKDSSTVLELETEAAEKVASPNAEEESASTKNGELPIEKVHYNVETADNNENTKELLTGIRTIPVGEETGNKVEVSSSGFKEQTEATELTVEKESVTKASHTEQHKEIIDFGASTSTDASKSCSEHSSSTSKVYEEQAEAEVSKIDKGVIDDAKIDSVTVVIEETDLKKVEQVNEENNKGSDIASDNYSLTTTAAEETTLDSKDLDERQEENSSLKKPFLDEANEGHLKMDCCVEEADKTTAIQHEREVATSSIHMSIEEKDTMTAAKINTTETADETAETHLQARENNLQQKEHEVGKPAGGTQLEGVDIKMECSNDNIIKQENENLHMLSHENTKATSTCKEGEVTQGQEILAHEDSEKFSSSSNFIAPEKLPAESSKIERNELPEEKILEPAHLDTKLKSSSDSEANNQTNEQLPQIKEKRDNIQDWISVSVEHIPGQTSMTNLITKEVHSGVDEAGGSENIEEHTRDSEDNLTELQILSARDTNVYQVKDQAFTSTENSKATESSEQKVKVGLTIEDDPTKKEAAAEVLKLESRTRQAESDLVSEIHENVPQMPLEPIEETIAEVQPKNAEPIRATGINAGVEETEVREEKFELPEEPPQAAANLDEEAKIGHEKDDKRGDECREMDPVSGSKDTDVKVAHKKSHSILSGVGSKVKHSISKVKKAITGKSSHPKSQSPKQTKQ